MVRLTISSPELDHEIWLPFMRPDQLTADRVLEEVDRVLQSDDEWLFKDFFVNFIHAPLPVGGKYFRWGNSLQNYLQKKKSLIQIPSTPENLCCARAIVTAKLSWKIIQNGIPSE